MVAPQLCAAPNSRLFKNSQPIGVGAGSLAALRCGVCGRAAMRGRAGLAVGCVQKTWCSHDASAAAELALLPSAVSFVKGEAASQVSYLQEISSSKSIEEFDPGSD